MAKSESTDGFVSHLPGARERFLSQLVHHALASGWRTPEDFLRQFPPAAIMESLSSATELRARLLVATTGVHEKIARKKCVASAGEDLQLALDERITDPAAVVAAFAPDERVRHLDARRLWRFVVEGESWSPLGNTTGAGRARAVERLTFIVERALAEQIVTLRDVFDGLTFDEIASCLPQTELQAVVTHALRCAREGTPLGEERFLEVVRLESLLEHIAIDHSWQRVVLDRIALPAGFVEGPVRSSPSSAQPTVAAETPAPPAEPRSEPRNAKKEPGWSLLEAPAASVIARSVTVARDSEEPGPTRHAEAAPARASSAASIEVTAVGFPVDLDDHEAPKPAEKSEPPSRSAAMPALSLDDVADAEPDPDEDEDEDVDLDEVVTKMPPAVAPVARQAASTRLGPPPSVTPAPPRRAEPGSDRPPFEDAARGRVMAKLASIGRLPANPGRLSLACLLSIENLYAELPSLETESEREECLRDAFPNEAQLRASLLALIGLLDPSMDLSQRAIRDADLDTLIAVFLDKERQSQKKSALPPPPASAALPPLPPPPQSLPRGVAYVPPRSISSAPPPPSTRRPAPPASMPVPRHPGVHPGRSLAELEREVVAARRAR
jgi:hypothetical protein